MIVVKLNFTQSAHMSSRGSHILLNNYQGRECLKDKIPNQSEFADFIVHLIVKTNHRKQTQQLPY